MKYSEEASATVYTINITQSSIPSQIKIYFYTKALFILVPFAQNKTKKNRKHDKKQEKSVWRDKLISETDLDDTIREFKMTIINMLRAPIEKIENM